LVATALSIPDSWKEPSSPKKLLTDALGALLPDGVINRQKMGFVLPWETWMRGPLKPLCEQGLNALHRLECLNGRELDGLWAAFLRGDKRVNCTRVWMLVTLGNWMNRHGIS
jgi:asparagine synthase (glutamine-hydrolysing)